MKLRLALLIVLMALPLAGCDDTAEKRAELQKAQAELHSLTLEIEQMRTRLPLVVQLEEENKGLQRQVYHLSVEVDTMRRQLAVREARRKKHDAQKAAASRSNAR